jgi:DNA polymerase-1
MPPTGTKSPLFYVLGEAPGKEEDETGIQFCGPSGELLRRKLETAFKDSEFFKGNLERFIRWNNCARCRPPRNETPNEFILECCKDFIVKDIEETKPLVILGFGGVPLKFLIGQEGIQTWRGRRLPIKVGNHSAWYFPLLHPAFILRNPKSEWEKIFESDLYEVSKFLENSWEEPEVISDGYTDNIECILGNSSLDFQKLLSSLNQLQKEKVIAIDIETVNLRPFQATRRHQANWSKLDPKLISIAVGTDERIIAFPLEHPQAWNGSRQDVFEATKKFLLNPNQVKVAHFLPFELEWFTHYFGPELANEGLWGDTLAQAYIINEKTSRQSSMLSLDTLTLLHFGFEIKSLSSVDVKNLLLSPLREILLYNGMDAKYTHKLYKKQQPRLVEKLKDCYSSLIETTQTLALMQNSGVLVDLKKAEKFQLNEEKKLAALENKIMALPEVKQFEEERSMAYNLRSNDHIAYILENILNLPAVKLTGEQEDGKYSTDKEVLDIFAKKGIKLAKYTLEYREVNKIKTTYLDPVPGWVYEDGILHTKFKSTVTSTGRLASENPNMQNFPKRKGRWVRELIIPPPGYWFVSIDYGQIEARVIAMASKDPVFSKKIREGYDIHKEWALIVLEHCPTILGTREVTDEMLDVFRSAIKNQLVFPWLYGSAMMSVADTLGISKPIITKIYNQFWDTFAGVLKWQERVVQFYNEHGYVETLTGRRRHGPLGKNEIINSPIQGTASDIVVDAMNRLRKIAWQERKPQYLARLNVHDELDFYIPDETLEHDIEFVSTTMCSVPFPFIGDIPIEVEASVGPNWGVLNKVGKFTSKVIHAR